MKNKESSRNSSATSDLSVCIGRNYTIANYEKQSPFYARSDYPDHQSNLLLYPSCSPVFLILTEVLPDSPGLFDFTAPKQLVHRPAVIRRDGRQQRNVRNAFNFSVILISIFATSFFKVANTCSAFIIGGERRNPITAVLNCR